MDFIRKLFLEERAATAIEYGLIAALISIGIVTAVMGIGDEVKTSFNTTSSAMADT